jgi:hypothetical protein
MWLVQATHKLRSSIEEMKSNGCVRIKDNYTKIPLVVLILILLLLVDLIGKILKMRELPKDATYQRCLETFIRQRIKYSDMVIIVRINGRSAAKSLIKRKVQRLNGYRLYQA